MSRLRNLLTQFVFFHLGSDAQMEVREISGGGACVRFSHARIHPCEWKIRPADLEKLLVDRDRMEEEILKLLTRYRRT